MVEPALVVSGNSLRRQLHAHEVGILKASQMRNTGIWEFPKIGDPNIVP